MEAGEGEARRGLALSKRLWKAAVASGSNRARRRAVLIGRCSDPDNTWTAEVADAEGRAFEAFGRKTCCGSRLCPYGIKLLQRKAQRRLVAARDDYWKSHVREIGKCERFITLTGPTLQGMSLEDSNKIFNRAFALLSARAFWSGRIEAGAKHVEFTVNQQGYHTHIHLLVYGAYIERDVNEEAKSRAWRSERAARPSAHRLRLVTTLPPLGNLQDEWTECLSEAVRDSGREIEWNAAGLNEGWHSRFPLEDGEIIEVQPTPAAKANVDVRLVREKGRPVDGEIGLPGAVKELTKYITKASSWSDVSDEQLVAIAEVKRWPRCFELLGGWRRALKDREAKPPAALIQIRPNESWEDFCRRVEREAGDPASYVLAWDTLNNSGTLYAADGGYASLDTDYVFPSSSEPSESPPSRRIFIRPRAPSLMALGEGMNFTEWLKIVSIRLAGDRRARARLLTKRYPHTRFRCLDGSEFGETAISSIASSADGCRRESHRVSAMAA